MAKPKKTSPVPDDLNPAVATLLASLSKAYGKSAVRSLAEAKDFLQVERQPTGIPSLDQVLRGGYPKGSIIEVYGWEGVGKTSLMIESAKTALNAPENAGKVVAFIDCEHSIDYDHLVNRYGIDPKRFYLVQQSLEDKIGAEQLLDIALTWANSEACCLVVVDSVASLVPINDAAKNLADGSMAAQRAQLLHRACRKLMDRPRSSCPVVMVNQLQSKVGGMGGPGASTTTTPGGGALKFYASLRILLARYESIKGKGDVEVGFSVQAGIIKARFSTPKARALYSISYENGIECERALITMAKELGVIETNGTWFTIFGERLQGYAKAIQYLKDNPALYQDLKDNVDSALAQTSPLPDDDDEGEDE